MRSPWIAPLILAVIVLVAAASSPADPTTRPATKPATSPTALTSNNRGNRLAHEVDQAIARGQQFLLSRENENGSWSEGFDAQMDVGRSALVGLALLSCGQPHDSPAMIRTIAFLKHTKIGDARATYCYALRAAFYSQLPTIMREQELKQDVLWLQASMIRKGSSTGLYSYNRNMDFVGGDFSNSQYGVLGVWYAAMAGAEINGTYWRTVEAAWKKGQGSDGGFGYTPGDQPSYASMTAAGAATFFITNDYLHASQEQNLQEPHPNLPLEMAVKWLGDHFAADRNAGRDPAPTPVDSDLLGTIFNTAPRVGTWVHYMLYGYERVGEASGLTHFGSHNWFDEGAKYLIDTQNTDGSWEGSSGRTVDTAYALLFLSRGRSPVALQKLQFGDRWNNRSRDAAAISHWLTQETERHINWQIIPADASPAEFRQAPILYIASDQAFRPSDPQRQLIKTYIDQGGCVLAVNEGTADTFAQSIRSLGDELYPQYTFRDLPANHPIYTENFSIKNLPTTPQGLSNGVRELMILLPTGDMSWNFQQGAGTTTPALAPAFSFVANLYAYLNDKSNPRFKGDDTWISPDPTAQISHRITLARLKTTDKSNWNPEPVGWARLSNIVRNSDRLDLQIAEIDPVGLTNGFQIAHLTATDPFDLTPPQTDALKHYLDTGGLLLFDAAGGSVAAQLAFEALMQRLYPDAKFTPLPPDHPIYTGQGFGGENLQQVIYRRFAAERIGKTNAPLLRTMEINHRIAVIDSAEDLSAGLVGYNIDGITGYSPASAVALARNILLFSLARYSGRGPG